ncbi:MAG: tetratricopeptide repeat protein [Deltaproteobacteria bacterium]|nr:tetratricopeptide repeat protein [Deltaproteobacteria bacterium]
MSRALSWLALVLGVGCAHAPSPPRPVPAAQPSTPAAQRQQELALRRAQVAGLRRGDPGNPPALLRLAELLVDDALAAWRLALESDPRVLELRPPAQDSGSEGAEAAPGPPPPWFDPERAQRLRPDAREALARSVALAREATPLLERVVLEHPGSPEAPDAIALEAWLLGELQHPEVARQAWHRLLRSFPDSPRAGEAWLAFGEHFFSAGRFPQALEAYQRALSLAPPRLHGFARYKLAWCYANLNRDAEALQAFERTVADALASPTPAPLAREAFRDGLRVLVQSRQGLSHGDVLSWRDARPAVPAAAALRQAAELLDDLGRAPEALALWLALATLEPAQACQTLANAAESARRAADPQSLARVAAAREVARCGAP